MYEFKRISLDDYELRYKDKVIPFKRDIEIANRLQSITSEAKLKMYKDLTSKGMTKDDLVVKRKVDGKEIIDETNYKEYEKQFINESSLIILNEIFEKCFKKTYTALFAEMIDEDTKNLDEEAMNFGKEFTMIMLGKDDKETPSQEKAKEE